jgi:hypothetical protein
LFWRNATSLGWSRSGTAPPGRVGRRPSATWQEPIGKAFQCDAAIGKGIPVVISTRVPTGRVLPVYGFKGGGKTLKDAGAIFADDLSAQKARLLLMLALQTTSKPAEIQKLFDR